MYLIILIDQLNFRIDSKATDRIRLAEGHQMMKIFHI